MMMALGDTGKIQSLRKFHDRYKICFAGGHMMKDGGWSMLELFVVGNDTNQVYDSEYPPERMRPKKYE
jgi:hypothetical protein